LRRARGRRTILFIDEIHRFNKAQQTLSPAVESGDIILIGATTENPSFEVNAPLLSGPRCRAEAALRSDTVTILRRALADREQGLGGLPINVTPEAVLGIARYANGDGRVALNLLEFAAASAPSVDGVAQVDAAFLKQSIERRALLYDKTGEEHYKPDFRPSQVHAQQRS